MSKRRRLRHDAMAIFQAAVAAAQPAHALARHLRLDGDVLSAGKRRYRLDQFHRIFITGCGKATAAMAAATEKILSARRVTGGVIVVKDEHTAPLKRVEIVESSHPVPDERGVTGARRVAALCEQAGERDLVIALISGGGSALLPLPASPITLAEKQKTTKLLLACGASIHEINAVRKHLSAVKGGQLARLASPATVIALLLSDVIGDPLDVIASGPFAPDDSTWASAWSVLERYGLTADVPVSVRGRMENGKAGGIPDTPKPGDPCFDKVQNLVIGSNAQAVEAAAGRARALGYRPLILSTTIEGETRDVARMHAAIAREAAASGRPARPPLCLISGGETTVTLRGDGMGGRNQEFALAAALDIARLDGVLAFSAGTDGTDGPTPAAGALADGRTLDRAAALGLDPNAYLTRNDSYRFFEPLGDLVMTGPTGTNVMDIRLMLIVP
jgi:hydroxypyruvate reductase